MGDTCPTHAHPELVEPIDEELFRAEVAAVLLAAGVAEREVRGASVSFPEELRRRHELDPRAYAEVHSETLTFRFAPQALALPEANRLGLICHEVGHVLDPEATENGADTAAERALGIRINYDPRWPGKGLQRLELRPGARWGRLAR